MFLDKKGRFLSRLSGLLPKWNFSLAGFSRRGSTAKMEFFSLVGFSRRGLHIITTHKLLIGLIVKVTQTNTHTHFYTCKDERAICLN